MKTNNQIFNAVSHPAPNGNWFDLSHSHRTTGQMGALIPVFTDEVLAGDTWKINAKNLIRLMPLATPAMDRINVVTTAFFVPFRILWPGDASIGTGWESFFTNGGEQVGTPPPAMPQYDGNSSIAGDVFGVGRFHDYIGLPVGVPTGPQYGTPISALYRQAYDLIWWEWYRDQNLQGADQGYVKPSVTPGPTNIAKDLLNFRNWPRDYYTSQLPFAQKGDPVTIPVAAALTGTAPVEVDPSGTNRMFVKSYPSDVPLTSSTIESDGTGQLIADNGIPNLAWIDPNGSLEVDGSYFDLGAISTTINDLRTAFAIQSWLELNAVGGTRFIEALKVHFGTAPTDARLQRPEIIGSQFQLVAVSEVLQTSQTDTTPLGTMGGHGISSNGRGFFNYHAQEPGIIMVLTSIFPDASYHQGLHRRFTRQSYFDFAWPSFARLGEQATLKREVVAKADIIDQAGSKAYNEETFGYMPRFAEYRFHNNHTTGLLRPGQSMEAWTQTQDYSTVLGDPLELNDSFIRCKPSSRIFVDMEASEQIIMQWGFDIKAFRLLPKYGTPFKLS